MRVFVAVALAILLVGGLRLDPHRYLDVFDLRGLRIGPGVYYDLLGEYLLFPFLAAFTVKYILWRLRPSTPRGPSNQCACNLAADTSGVCPECGKKIVIP